MPGIHTGEDLSVSIQILIQKHLSPKVILDKIIKKQIINAYFKTKSKTTKGDKLLNQINYLNISLHLILFALISGSRSNFETELLKDTLSWKEWNFS